MTLYVYMCVCIRVCVYLTIPVYHTGGRAPLAAHW